MKLLRASLAATFLGSTFAACSPSNGSGAGDGSDGGGASPGGASGVGATPSGGASGVSGTPSGGVSGVSGTPSGGVSGTGLGGNAGVPPTGGVSGVSGAAGAPVGGTGGLGGGTSGTGGDGSSGASATGGDAGGGTGGAAGTGPGAYPGTIIIQDNFDASAMVDAKWTRYPSFNMAVQPVIDTARKHSGANSVRTTGNSVGSFLIPASGQLGGTIATGNKFYVRVWANFEKATSAVGNHSTFLVGSVAQDNSGTELRLGFSSNQSGKPEMLDLNLQGATDGGEVTRYSNGFTDGGNPGAFSGMGVQFVANQWYCFEALFDGAGSEFRLWVGEVENMEMHVHDFSGSGTAGRTTWGPMFRYLKIGTQDFSGQIGQVWYDDVFVGTAPIGCQR